MLCESVRKIFKAKSNILETDFFAHDEQRNSREFLVCRTQQMTQYRSIADARIEIEKAVSGREWTTSGIATAGEATLPAPEEAPRGVLGGWAGLAAGLILGGLVTWFGVQALALATEAFFVFNVALIVVWLVLCVGIVREHRKLSEEAAPDASA